MSVNSSAFLRLAWKNVKNRPFRNIATLLCFAFVAASLFSAQYLIGGASHSLEAGTSRMGADMMVVPSQYIALGETVILRGEPSSFFFRMSSLDRIAGVEGVEQASPQIYIATLYGAECCSAPVQMIAFDPGRDFTIMPWLESSLGRMLERDEIVVGSRIQGDIGSQLKFYGHDYTIAGRLEPTGMGTDYSVFVQMDDAYVMAAESGEKAVMRLDIPEGQVSAVLIQIGEGSDLEAVAAKIEHEVPGTKVITPDTLVVKISEQLQVLVRLLYLTTMAVMIISLPLIALVSSMVANERRREVGILRAMGATRHFVFRLTIVESLILALLGGIIGVLGAFIVISNFQDYISMSLQIPFLAPNPVDFMFEAGLVLVLCAGAGVVSSLYPAFRSSRLDPYSVIREGESC